MSTPCMETDFGDETIARLSRHKRLGLGTRPAARPASARLNARSSIGGLPTQVDFVRRLAAERRMRAMLVVPIDEGNKLTPKRLTSLRNQDTSSAFVLHRKNETLDHGDTSVLADGPIARRLEALSLAPALEP